MRSALALVVVLASLLFAPSAQARVAGDVAYSYAQTWQAAIRMIRVDLACPVTDRDEENGFLLFDYQHSGRSYPGSVEIVRSTDEHGVEHIRVAVQVSAMPTYVERMMLDRLTRKLRDDFGEPRRPRPVAPTPPAAEPAEPAPEAPVEDAPEA